MALKFATGFEMGELTADYWTDTNGPPTVVSTSPRSDTGSYYASCGSSQRFGVTTASQLHYTLDPSTETFYIGFAMRIGHGAGNARMMYGSFGSTTNAHYITLEFPTDGSIDIYAADSVFGTDITIGSTNTGVIVDNTWHYIEFQYWSDNTNGRAKLLVDGSNPSAASGSTDFTGDTQVDTTRSSGGFICRFQAGTSGTMDIDDIYFCTDTAAGNDPYTSNVGDRRIEALVPTSDTAANWTRSTGSNSYDLLDDIVPVNSTYVETNVSTTEDQYGLGNMTLSGTPDAVVIHTRANRVAGALDLNVHTHSGAVDDTDAQTLDTTITDRPTVHAVDVDTGNPVWDTAAVNALEIGIEAV